MANHVFVTGQFEHVNFGDLLMAKIYQDRIISAGKRPVFVASNKKPLSEHVCSKEAVLSPSEAVAMFDRDHLLLAGGGYLAPPNFRSNKWALGCLERRSLWWLESIVDRAESVVAHSVELGRSPVDSLNKKVKKLLANADLVCVRNTESLHYANKLGLNATLVPDCVHSWVSQYKRTVVPAECEVIGVHVTEKLFSPRDPLAKLILGRIKKICLKQAASELMLVEDQPVSGRVREQALDFLRSIKSQGMFVRYEPFESLSKVVDITKSIDLLFTTKLHLGVMVNGMGGVAVWIHDNDKSARYAFDQGLVHNSHKFHHLQGLVFAISGSVDFGACLAVNEREVAVDVDLESFWSA